MKKLVALLLAVCMLFGSAAIAEKNARETAFLNNLEKLLKTVNLTRDMLTLDVDYEGSSVFSGKMKWQDQMVDLSVSAPDTNLLAQVSETDVTVSVNDSAFNLQFSDVEALLAGLKPGKKSSSLDIYKELALLLFQKVIMPDVTMGYLNGTHIVYRADAKQLMTHLVEFLDAVSASKRYAAAAEQLIQMIGQMSGGDTMTLAEMKESAEAEIKRLETAETDFAIAFELIADKAFKKIDVTGEIGDSRDKYSMKWNYRNEEDSYKLDGLLWKTRVMGEKTRKYEITVKADFRGDKEHNLWNLSVTHPSIGFNVEASGNREGGMGSFFLSYNPMYRAQEGFIVQLDYARSDDGFIATALVKTPGSMGNYIATLVAGEKQFNLTVKNYYGLKLFLLNLFADDNKNLKYGYMEYDPNPMLNPFSSRPAVTGKVTALYDGEKLVITSNGVTVTCTAAFESDHAYVITLHAEGENVKPEEDTAYIRLEYEGKKGNFTVTGRVIDPTGKDLITAKLACAPTEGITEILRDREGVVKLTPETLQMMLPR